MPFCTSSHPSYNSGMTTPILTTKLYIPPARAELVSRPRLTARLAEGHQRPGSVTLISAPPGFGKTTLVSSWIYDADASEDIQTPKASIENRVAWVSLDEQDNDPIRFWSHLFAALETLQKGIAANAHTLLLAPQPQPIESTLTTLINALSTMPDAFTLALDDYHVIERPPLHEGLTFLLENMPPRMHLILISRSDPPLPLTRLRVRNRLTEIRESDLRFTADEAATFLQRVMGLHLSAEEVAALETRTEGWVAGLQLAALSMQGRRDVHSFVQAFTGSHRYVIDYLAEEVLAQQPQPVRDFLLKTSILERLSGPLCDAILSGDVAGTVAQSPISQSFNLDLNPPISSPPNLPTSQSPTPPTSQQTLEYLDQANLFLIPLDDKRRWYRYHHLFADCLQEHLRKTVDEDSIADLHRRASEWYMAHDYPTDAVNHALTAGDTARVAHLVEKLSIELLTLGEAVTLLKWLDALPAEMVRAHPRLSLTQAWSHVILGHWADIEAPLRDAEAALQEYRQSDSPPDQETRGLMGEAAAIQSMILRERGETHRSIALSEQALDKLPPDSLLAQSVIHLNLGGSYETIGEFDKAAYHLTAAVSLAQKTGNLITVLSASGILAELYQARGRFEEAVQSFRRALEYIEGYSRTNVYAGQSLPMTGRTYLGLAEIARKRSDLEQAINYLNLGLNLGEQGNIGGTLHVGHIISAQIHQAQGNFAAAHEALEKAKQYPQDIAPTFQWTDAVQARLWLAEGKLSAAVRWAETADLPLEAGNFQYAQFPGEYATLVRVYLAQEKFEAATELLQRMEAAEEAISRDSRRLEILMLQALTFYVQGQFDRALPPLEQALAIAERTGYIRLLLDEGPPMADLLRRAALNDIARDFIETLLPAFALPEPRGTLSPQSPNLPTAQPPNRPIPHSPAPTPAQINEQLIEPLTDRELEILDLIAEGLSNQEIADRLIIAEGTVKKHIHNIFGKLDVRRRTQVVLRAKELGLLVD